MTTLHKIIPPMNPSDVCARVRVQNDKDYLRDVDCLRVLKKMKPRYPKIRFGPATTIID